MACVRQSWWPCFPRADRTQSLWHRFVKTDHLKQNSTVKQSWVWRKLASAQLPVKTSRIDKQLSAHQRKSSIEAPQQHISPSASCVPQLYNQRLSVATPSTLYVEVALCLNWIDECIVTAIVFFPFVCYVFLFIMLLNCKSVFKGKVLTLLWKAGGVSVDLQFVDLHTSPASVCGRASPLNIHFTRLIYFYRTQIKFHALERIWWSSKTQGSHCLEKIKK